MKFTSKERKVTSSQKTMAIELGLADQKKAIELLYSQYSEPIKTCVQELVSNAFDAMQDAGKPDQAIKIQLPNALNDFYFSVRDFGNSMDDKAIKNVYMRVNASTKSTNNKAIGGFGIGSKTPWAYTDTFILKTYLNGLETQYALVKGRSSVSIVYSGETDQSNGTEVIFKAKERDEQNFLEAVKIISLCAKTKPIVNTKELLGFSKVTAITNSIRVVKSQVLSGGIYLNIGGVLYDLYYDKFISNQPWGKRDISDHIDNRLKKGTSLIIDMPIGSIMPLQTREGLFTGGDEGQHNKVMLKKVLKYTFDKLLEHEADEISEVTDELSAINFFNTYSLVTEKKFKFNNVVFSGKGILIDKYIISNVTRESKGWRSSKLKSARKRSIKGIGINDLNDVYFCEIVPQKAKLLKRFYNMSDVNDVIVLEKRVFEESDELELYKHLKELTKATNIETVEVPKTTPRAKTQRDNTKVKIYTSCNRHRMDYHTQSDPKDYANRSKIILVEKDTYIPVPSDLVKFLGYDIWFVAKTNVKKLMDTNYTFHTKDEFDSMMPQIAQLYTDYLADMVSDKLRTDTKALKYVLNFTDENKQKLLDRRSRGYSFDGWSFRALIDEIRAAYGDKIDKEVRTRVRKRVRVNRLLDKVPLVKHIDTFNLTGKAKEDLDSYITSNL